MSAAADLRTLRAAGWSDERIAAAVSVSARSISSWRGGAEPRPIYATKLARIAARVRGTK